MLRSCGVRRQLHGIIMPYETLIRTYNIRRATGPGGSQLGAQSSPRDSDRVAVYRTPAHACSFCLREYWRRQNCMATRSDERCRASPIKAVPGPRNPTRLNLYIIAGIAEGGQY